ncbi:MAG: HK97 family phage prohead protease [Anaerotignum sp.]|nr:HK97 family phage prohead protease [Anaerotignum sp.]
MRIEVRADNTARITGYVNVVERESRPVITPRGRVNELVEGGVFNRALEASNDIAMTVDHNPDMVIANTSDGTLKLTEDNIGLRADAVIHDENVVTAAREGKIKGWSFGMMRIQDSIEDRADKLPLRRISGMVLDHVTLVINKIPVYSATSVELRAEAEEDIESRACDNGIEISIEEKRAEKIDYSKWEDKLKQLKGE